VSIELVVDEQKPPEEIIAELRAENAALRGQRDLAQARLDELLHRLYGRSSERYVDQGFGPLFEGQEVPEPPPSPHVEEAPDDEGLPDEAPARKPRRRGAPRLPQDIKRVVEDVEPSDEEKRCSCCGGEREVIGYEVTEKLEYQPANCYLRVIRRPKLVCKAHEEAGVVAPDLPSQAIHKGLAGETMLAQVATAKYCDHLPLYRQALIYARQGVDLPESTLCDWIAVTAQLVRPIVDAVAAAVFASGYVGTDDTGVRLLTKASPKGSKRAHLWSYVGEEPGDVVFDFTAGRDAEGPTRMLQGFEGYLQADAYSVYDKLFESGKIIEAGCMAHSRRKFFEAIGTAPQHAKPAMEAIQALYRVERECKVLKLSHDDRLAKRQVESLGSFSALREWLAELKAHVLPKSPIGKAVGYFNRHADALGRFLENGRLEIDNNRCERTMRKVAVGRKNWLFAGSEAGGKRAAILYSLTVGCWELGIDPFTYLSDVLQRLPSTPSSQVAQLTPRGWLQARHG
jgi:transposase